jgi:hypothetical protein
LAPPCWISPTTRGASTISSRSMTIAGVGAPPARGPKCGFRSLQYDHRSLRPSTARGPRILIKSDECGVVSESFRPTARNYRITRKDCVCAYVRANDRLNALQLLSRRQNPSHVCMKQSYLGGRRKRAGRLADKHLTNVRWTTRAPERGPWRGRGRHSPCVGAGARPPILRTTATAAGSVIALSFFVGDHGGFALVRSCEGARRSARTGPQRLKIKA